MLKAKCPECNQIVQKSIFDRCMYCGADLPVELRCSDDEKKKLTEIKKLYEEKCVKEYNKKKKQELENDLISPFDDWSF